MSKETIFEALGELDEDLIREAGQTPARRGKRVRLLPMVAAAVLLTVLLAVSTLAYGYVRRAETLLTRYRTARGDEIVGGTGGSREFHTCGDETCYVRDGRIYILLDGVEEDITKECSDTDYYSYDHTYDDGIRLLIVAGGTPEKMGWFWVYFFPETISQKAYSTFMLPCFYDYGSAPWAAKAEKDYSLEFMGLTAKPDNGDLKVPTVAELIEHGYPVNDRGETYGPCGFEEWLGYPDLGLALGKNGVHGYIRYSEAAEVDGSNVRTLEEALAWNEYVRQRGPVEIPIYKEDGETIVDWFVIGN